MSETAARWLVFLGLLAVVLLIALVVVLVTDDASTDVVAADSTTAQSTTSTPATSAPATTIAATTAATSAPATTGPAPTSTSTSAVAQGDMCAEFASDAIPADAVSLGGGNGVFGGGVEPESIQDSDLALLYESGGTHHLAFSLNVGYVATAQLPGASDPSFEPELVVVDFPGGHDAGLVMIDRSLASGAEVYAFYFLDEDCEVADAGTVEVPRYEFLDWAGAQHSQGFTCVDDGVFETMANAGEGGLWEITDTFFAWTAPAQPGFVFGFQDGMEVPEGDPAIAQAGAVDC